MKIKKAFEKQYIFKIKYIRTTKSVLKREKKENYFGEKKKDCKSRVNLSL